MAHQWRLEAQYKTIAAAGAHLLLVLEPPLAHNHLLRQMGTSQPLLVKASCAGVDAVSWQAEQLRTLEGGAARL